MLLGTLAILLIGKLSWWGSGSTMALHSIPLLIIILLLGVEYTVYRPALKCYTAEMVQRNHLPWASAGTEAAGFSAGAESFVWAFGTEDAGFAAVAGAFFWAFGTEFAGFVAGAGAGSSAKASHESSDLDFAAAGADAGAGSSA